MKKQQVDSQHLNKDSGLWHLAHVFWPLLMHVIASMSLCLLPVADNITRFSLFFVGFFFLTENFIVTVLAWYGSGWSQTADCVLSYFQDMNTDSLMYSHIP